MKIETQTPEVGQQNDAPTITLVTPSDQETVTILMSYDVREYYTLEVTKQQLIDEEFQYGNFMGNDYDWEVVRKECIDGSDDTEIDHKSQDLFDQWESEWENTLVKDI